MNVEGVFLGCKHAIPALAERAPKWAGGAAIVNLSSVAGLRGSAMVTCYNASKGAVRLLTKGVALEVASRNIRCNSVHPGVIDTLMGQEVVTGFLPGSAARATTKRASPWPGVIPSGGWARTPTSPTSSPSWPPTGRRS